MRPDTRNPDKLTVNDGVLTFAGMFFCIIGIPALDALVDGLVFP